MHVRDIIRVSGDFGGRVASGRGEIVADCLLDVCHLLPMVLLGCDLHYLWRRLYVLFFHQSELPLDPLST